MLVVSLLIGAGAATPSALGEDLDNGTLRLKLGFNAAKIPIIEAAEWTNTGETVFTDSGSSSDLTDWLPQDLVQPDGRRHFTSQWRNRDDAHFLIREVTKELPNHMRMMWTVELAREGALFRLHVRLKNADAEPRAVAWFPGWTAEWDVTEGVKWVRRWASLRYVPIQDPIKTTESIEMNSHLHSSDKDSSGTDPYWIVGGKRTRLHFGLEWCGGWDAKLSATDSGFRFAVQLPEEDTQLTLQPGEGIDGPVLIVTPTAEPTAMASRQAWMTQRLAMGRLLYKGPLPSFPITFNPWYSIGPDVDAQFLSRQIGSMGPYGFDAFIVDLGWYDAVGSWLPDSQKFAAGEFEQMMASLKVQGIRPGLWTAPQYVTAEGHELPVYVDDPPQFSDFVQGYLLDLSGSDFESRLLNHVSALRARYSIDWWKYDQPFFTDSSRAGVMRNVESFQDALKAVRAAQPDLTIENCESGGRMINELTLLATQTSWLRDGGDNGRGHAMENIVRALGSLEFVFPWAVYRWTNNLDRMDQNDDELTRFYCRSAMAGTWGISSDLSRIGRRQRDVVTAEIQNYRRLSEFKSHCLYDLIQPDDGTDAASVTFYDPDVPRAAVLAYRWNAQGTFTAQVPLTMLTPNVSYRITDVDTGLKTRLKGKILTRDGVSIPFGSDRLSALLFIEPAK
jgi:melibiase-like protein